MTSKCKQLLDILQTYKTNSSGDIFLVLAHRNASRYWQVCAKISSKKMDSTVKQNKTKQHNKKTTTGWGGPFDADPAVNKPLFSKSAGGFGTKSGLIPTEPKNIYTPPSNKLGLSIGATQHSLQES